ncbi:hypothetical protein DVH24_014456 [Malus domestica]|uniref:Reverse transcriptase zinc-binding domain-containing protein n=1 Tax=Malus domestica TaxID=3750 RepID=A0A498KHX4_MALDO|nr:hypothetical protein DVH24_014456 [Malus domestica]
MILKGFSLLKMLIKLLALCMNGHLPRAPMLLIIHFGTVFGKPTPRVEVALENICVLCNSSRELALHVFSACPFARAVFFSSNIETGTRGVVPSSFCNWLNQCPAALSSSQFGLLLMRCLFTLYGELILSYGTARWRTLHSCVILQAFISLILLKLSQPSNLATSVSFSLTSSPTVMDQDYVDVLSMLLQILGVLVCEIFRRSRMLC